MLRWSYKFPFTVSFSPNDMLLASCGDQHEILLWDMSRGKLLDKLVEKNICWGLDLSPDKSLLNELASAYSIHLWTPNNPNALELSLQEEVGRVAPLPANRCSLSVWGLGGVVIVDFPYHNGFIQFSPDGRYFYGGEETGHISIYDVVQMKKVGSFQTRSAASTIPLNNLFLLQPPLIHAISSDSTLFAVNNGLYIRHPYARCGHVQSVQVWETQHPDPMMSLIGEVESLPSNIYDVAFSPDNSVLAISANDDKVHLYNARSLEPITTVGIPNDTTVALAYSPDGRFLATGGSKGDLWLWDATIWSPLAGIAAHPDCHECIMSGEFDALHDIAWSHDGQLIATAGEESSGQSIRVWMVDDEK